MMMMMMCKRLAQVPMLCVPIYNMKLAMMQKNSHFYHVFSTYEDGRRQAGKSRCLPVMLVYCWRTSWNIHELSMKYPHESSIVSSPYPLRNMACIPSGCGPPVVRCLPSPRSPSGQRASQTGPLRPWRPANCKEHVENLWWKMLAKLVSNAWIHQISSLISFIRFNSRKLIEQNMWTCH